MLYTRGLHAARVEKVHGKYLLMLNPIWYKQLKQAEILSHLC